MKTRAEEQVQQQIVAVPYICFVCSVLSRLAYFTEQTFYEKYVQIFHESNINKQSLTKIASSSIEDIFNYTEPNELLETSAEQINAINYSTSNQVAMTNKNDNMSYISISTSNYSTIYIVADKVMRTIFVVFRGTYSVKSSLSYLKQSSLFAKQVCADSPEGYLLGIFKITQEVIHTIMESILYLAQNFLKARSPSSIKIVTTGHSLGASMSVIFSYLWIKMRNSKNASENTSENTSKNTSKNNKNVYFGAPYNILSNRVACVTFGSPRIMNKPAIKKYVELINDKYIMFRRIITKGDPFPHLPISSKKFETSFYHPDDYDKKILNNTLTCEETPNAIRRKTRKARKTRKTRAKQTRSKQTLKCVNVHDKSMPKLSSHGVYLGISYSKAANNLTNMKKEIRRLSDGKYELFKGDTICRVFLNAHGINNVAFFVLNDAKYLSKERTSAFSDSVIKIKHALTTDYSHQDILITNEMFRKIIDNMSEINPRDQHQDQIPLEPSLKDAIIKIDQYPEKAVENPKININCLDF